MNLAKYISDQHEENYKALMNEIKEELNKWRDKPCFQGWEGRWEGCSGWGTHVYPWLIHVNIWQKPLQCCKAIILQ